MHLSLLIFLHFFSFTLHTIYQRRILAVLDIIQKVGVVVISGRKSGEAAGLMNEDMTVTSPVYKTYSRGKPEDRRHLGGATNELQ